MLSRRECLRWLGALPLGAVACSTSATEDDDPSAADSASTARLAGVFDVVVIGAGLAGLRAAQVLRAAGKNVVVLEARDRIGGRIHTDRDKLGVPAELGASWFHDAPKNPLVAVAKRANITTRASDYSARVWRKGTPLAVSTSDGYASTFARQLETAIAGARTGESLRSALDRSVGQLGATARETFEWSLATEVVYDYGAEADHLDAKRLDDAGDEEKNNLIVHEYDKVPAAIAAGLQIRLKEMVTSVAQSAGGVVVKSTSGTFRAGHVVVTLPVGVLEKGSVTFSPPLSSRKQAALGRMGMGCLSKTHLLFDRVFWPLETDFLGRIAAIEEKQRWGYFVNVAKHNGQPVLIAFNGGDYAREVEAMTDEDIVADASAALRTMFPDAPAPIRVAQTKWSQDPLAGGSYSYLEPGARSDDRAALAASEGLVHFAGEATSSTHAATAHGAYLSGEAAAKAILG